MLACLECEGLGAKAGYGRDRTARNLTRLKFVGSIVRVRLIDFMVHQSTEMRPAPGLNLIFGPNGSGKSAFISAICLGLGGSIKDMERGSRIGSFVRKNAPSREATIEVREACSGMQ